MASSKPTMIEFKLITGVDPTAIDTVIYHHPCHDGYSAAFVAFYFLTTRLGKSIELIPSGIKDDVDLEKVTGKNVLMVDIVSPNFMAIKGVAKNLIILDHHKTNEAALTGIPYAYFDMHRSGVGLAWQYFSDEPIPLPLACVEDRDIWTWKIPQSRFFCDGLQAALDLKDKEFKLFHELLANEKKFEELYKDGERINLEKERKIKGITGSGEKNKYEVTVNRIKYIAYFYNNTEFDLVSDLGNYVINTFECDFAVIWKYDHDQELFTYSLRSKDSKADVSEICKFFGGGGHRNAAGMASLMQPQEVFLYRKL
jgi:oligoribonuclease NrnB/cAMP/cGMP phosphodiesterase (DHH superfamily)